MLRFLRQRLRFAQGLQRIEGRLTEDTASLARAILTIVGEVE